METLNLGLYADLCLRWAHVICALMWIGMLFFYMFVFHQIQPIIGEAAKIVNQPIMARAIFWSRWGATLTIVFGTVMYVKIYWWTGEGFGATGFLLDPTTHELSARSWWIHTGMGLGIIMWGWLTFVAGPVYNKILVPGGPPPNPTDQKKLKIGGALNLFLSGPVLFMMLGTNHYSSLNVLLGVSILLGLLVIFIALKSSSKVKGP